MFAGSCFRKCNGFFQGEDLLKELEYANGVKRLSGKVDK